MMTTNHLTVGFVGFGEVAYYLSRGLAQAGAVDVVAYDVNARHPTRGELIRQRAQEARVRLVASEAQVARRTDLVISAVHGHVALQVAQDIALHLRPGQLFADLNNTAPSTKQRAAAAIQAAGAQFVDVGLFETPARAGLQALMLVSGSGAGQFKALLDRFGANVEVVPGDAGKATTIKTLANIYYKGVQALYLELALCARQAGVDPSLLGSLLVQPAASLPRQDEMGFWLVRSGLHAARKVAELEQIIQAIEEWGVEPALMQAARQRFERLAEFDLRPFLTADASPDQVATMLDAMARIARERGVALR
jgi:3-hydroxyisobutyrate dehydrogenase-like beta-hydroxyacid dehydrogenase